MKMAKTLSYRIIITLASGAILPLVDTTIVSMAIDPLVTYFNVSASIVAWIAISYLLAAVSVIPFTTWLISAYGSKKIWISGLIIFLTGSLLSGFSWNIYSLIFFRIIEGMGAGILMPMLLTLIYQIDSADARKMFTVIGSITAWAPIVGPFLGSAMLSMGTWRLIFWINVPIVIISIIMASIFINVNDEIKTESALDLKGGILLIIGFSGIIYAVTIMDNLSIYFIISLTSGVISLILYVLHAVRSGNPLLDILLYKVRPFQVNSVLLILTGFAFYGGITFLPLWLETVRDVTASLAGLYLIIMGLGALLARTLLKYIKSNNKIIIEMGWLITVIGTIPFIYKFDSTGIILLTSLFVRGFGMGILSITVLINSFTGLSGNQIKHASAFTRVLLILGGAIGTGILSLTVAGVKPGISHLFAVNAVYYCFMLIEVVSIIGLATSLLLKNKYTD